MSLHRTGNDQLRWVVDGETRAGCSPRPLVKPRPSYSCQGPRAAALLGWMKLCTMLIDIDSCNTLQMSPSIPHHGRSLEFGAAHLACNGPGFE